MSCDNNLIARRNADFRVTFSPASDDFTFADLLPELSIRRDITQLLLVSGTVTPNGSNFIIAGDSAVATIKEADLLLLDGTGSDLNSDDLHYDLVMTDATGFRNWVMGGAFILSGLNDSDNCGSSCGSVEISLGGQCFLINVDGGNLGPASSVGLAELNQAVGEAREAAEDAEAAAAQAATAGSEAGAISGASAGSASGTIAGDAAGTAAANLVVGNKVDLDAGNITAWDTFKAGARISVRTLADLQAIPAGGVSSVLVDGKTQNNDGYAGLFEWVAGDQSANVSNDTMSGVWVPPSGQDGSSGAWLRIFTGMVSPQWFGAVGDGVANDTAAFTALESVVLNREADLGGRTYLLDNGFTGNVYFNGYFLVAGTIHPVTNITALRVWSQPNRLSGPGVGGVSLGNGAAANIPAYTDWSGATGYVAIGRDALGSAERGRSCIAIGSGVMDLTTRPGFDNIGIGSFTLRSVFGDASLSASSLPGSRNIAIGGNAGYALTSGNRNILIGRNAGHCLTTAIESTAVGYRALSAGTAPLGLDGQIHVQNAGTAEGQSAFGVDSLKNSNGNGNTGVGRRSGRYVKTGTQNTFVGDQTGAEMDIDLSENNKVVTNPNLSGTYSQTGTTITISITAHGAIAGNKVGIRFTSGEPSVATSGEMQWLTVATVPNANTFTLASPVSQTASGNCVLDQVETATTRNGSSTNTYVGSQAGYQAPSAQGVTAVGWQSAAVFGGLNSTFVGQRAGMGATTGEGVTALGTNALRFATAGGAYLGGNNVTGVGFDSRVSGDNQVQLGNSLSTTYCFGTVQNRSDERDKADVRDTHLGLDFINALRPVDYRWDMRDDYIEIDPKTDEVVVREKDGSKKRSRFHHGFVAQEVQQLIADGIIADFGGFQDHSINGGSDVQSIGYDEMIAPLVKAVQELYAMVATLTEKENK